MDKETAARSILRSLCANLPTELPTAQENYRNTRSEQLALEGVEKEYLEKILNYYRWHGRVSAGSIG